MSVGVDHIRDRSSRSKHDSSIADCEKHDGHDPFRAQLKCPTITNKAHNTEDEVEDNTVPLVKPQQLLASRKDKSRDGLTA